MHAPAGRGRHHHARSVRQLRPQRHRLPARRRLPHGGVRRHALRERADVLPARPRRHAGLRAQVQGRVLGLQGQRLRPDQLPRPRRHRAHARGDGKTVRGFELVVGGGLGAVPQAAQAVRRVPARGGAAADARRRCAACSRASARRRTARARASSSWSRSSASRSSSGWCSRSAPSCAPIRAGRRSSPTCTTSTRSRSARPGRCRRGRTPTGSPSGRRPTSSRSASRAT